MHLFHKAEIAISITMEAQAVHQLNPVNNEGWGFEGSILKEGTAALRQRKPGNLVYMLPYSIIWRIKINLHFT